VSLFVVDLQFGGTKPLVELPFPLPKMPGEQSKTVDRTYVYRAYNMELPSVCLRRTTFPLLISGRYHHVVTTYRLAPSLVSPTLGWLARDGGVEYAI